MPIRYPNWQGANNSILTKHGGVSFGDHLVENEPVDKTRFELDPIQNPRPLSKTTLQLRKVCF